MYDELVKVLRRCVLSEPCEGCPYYDPHGPTEKCATLNIAAADAIEELSAVVRVQKAVLEKFPRWVPVTERLPECELGAEIGNVEWISCGMVFTGCFGRGGKYRDAYFRTWTDATEGIDAKDADCWRLVPLPQPPEEE